MKWGGQRRHCNASSGYSWPSDTQEEDHLLLDRTWPQVMETAESQTVAKGARLIYRLALSQDLSIPSPRLTELISGIGEKC